MAKIKKKRQFDFGIIDQIAQQVRRIVEQLSTYRQQSVADAVALETQMQQVRSQINDLQKRVAAIIDIMMEKDIATSEQFDAHINGDLGNFDVEINYYNCPEEIRA